MKNKIFTKVILVVVCVSTLLVTFVVPSFAYQWTNTTSLNNSEYSFTLPRSEIVLKKGPYAPSYDIPDTFYLTTAGNTGRDAVVNGSFDYRYSDIPLVSSNMSILTTVENSNVYSTSYYYGGYYSIWSSYGVPDYTEYYYLDSIVYGDCWLFNVSPSSYCGTIYNSLSLSIDEEPFYNNNGVPYFNLNYAITYISSDGELHDVSLTSSRTATVFTDGSFSGYTLVIPYLPIEFSSYDVVYIVSSVIDIVHNSDRVDMPDATKIFYDPENQFTSSTQVVCDFACRFVPPSRFVPDNYVQMVTDITLNGYNNGLTDGWDNGYDFGLEDGYYQGFDEGYLDGFEEGSKLYEKSPFDLVLDSIDAFISWEFIPGVSIGIVLTIVIGISLLIAFLKVFAGG